MTVKELSRPRHSISPTNGDIRLLTIVVMEPHCSKELQIEETRRSKCLPWWARES